MQYTCYSLCYCCSRNNIIQAFESAHTHIIHIILQNIIHIIMLHIIIHIILHVIHTSADRRKANWHHVGFKMRMANNKSCVKHENEILSSSTSITGYIELVTIRFSCE